MLKNLPIKCDEISSIDKQVTGVTLVHELVGHTSYFNLSMILIFTENKFPPDCLSNT